MAKSRFQALTEPYQAPALMALEDFLRIDSVYDPKTVSAEMPFGKGVREALDYVISLGTGLGFQADACGHYVSELSYGEGPLVDIYAHADVVPVSPNWETDPFTPVIRDGNLFARGSADDKGPGIAALFAAKALIDAKMLKGCRLRIIFGGNEENGSRGLEHYFQALKKGYPAYGFTPDADYPLIFAEKGIYSYEAEYDLDLSIPDFGFGLASNIVLDEASLPMEDKNGLGAAVRTYQAAHPEVMASYKEGKVCFRGKAVHGSQPWDGVNAGLHLLNFLGVYLREPKLCRIFADYEHGDGKPFAGSFTSGYFDSTSYCIGLMSYKQGRLALTVNIRIPENITIEKALDNVRAKTGADAVVLLGGSPALVVNPDSAFIRTLMKAYREETGDLRSKPLAIGGGTYARDSKNSVAFGMEFPGVDSKMHQDGEFMRLKDFYLSLAIYAHAIYGLSLLAAGGKED